MRRMEARVRSARSAAAATASPTWGAGRLRRGSGGSWDWGAHGPSQGVKSGVEVVEVVITGWVVISAGTVSLPTDIDKKSSARIGGSVRPDSADVTRAPRPRRTHQLELLHLGDALRTRC